MTYCLAIKINEGLVFCSDSRTNAGADRISTYSKMHRFCVTGDRFLTLLTAGNLATSQAVVAQIKRDLEEGAKFNISDAKYVADIAEYVGRLGVCEQKKYSQTMGQRAEIFDAGASFILGGQITGRPSELFLIYPEGNYISAPDQHPYLQIGETKYGKPILDRIILPTTSAEVAMRCGLLSLDSTMRSNVTVGPPLECLFYRENSFNAFEQYYTLPASHPYLQTIRETWDKNIRIAFEKLPRLSEQG